MHNALINKYLSNKQKVLCEYASVLYKIYGPDADSLWQQEFEFQSIIKNVVKTYVEKYYLRSKDELEELNTSGYAANDFKLALALAVIADAYGDKYDNLKISKKKGLYNLTIIVYIITNIDRDVTFMDAELSSNSIMQKLSEYFKSINQEKLVTKNPFVMNNLANRIKDNKRLEKKFFGSLDNKESFNTFAKYDKDSYFVKYNFDSNLFDKYRDIDVRRVYEKYDVDEDYFDVSYELASVTILKQFVLGHKVYDLILPVTSSYLENNQNIKLINDLFGNPFIKNKIKFSIYYSDYDKKRDKFNILREDGYKLGLFMDREQMILDYSNIKLDLEIYAKDKFIENNPKFKDFVINKDIAFHIVNRNIYKSENDLLIKCKED